MKAEIKERISQIESELFEAAKTMSIDEYREVLDEITDRVEGAKLALTDRSPQQLELPLDFDSSDKLSQE